MKYYKRPWDETRGDEQDHWGTSIWYFEVGDDDYPVKLAEVYQNGPVLKYDETNIEDEYGALSDVALDAEEFAGFAISKDEFDAIWESNK